MIHHFALLNSAARTQLIQEIATQVIPVSPFFTPTTKGGAFFNYQMTNCGELGWVSDRRGYRYTSLHPTNSRRWALLSKMLLEIIEYLKLGNYIPREFKPESCLINKYVKGSKLGKHRDETEKAAAPIISLSLGAPGIFQLGGNLRTEKMVDYLLKPGDVFILSECDRFRHHAFKGITAGEKRINLTIRQVNH
jgi:alkylated DNA repair protein (DNA oxidative demethylase)